MSIIGLLVVFVIVGFGLWMVNTYIPMQPPFKVVINVVVVLLLLVWLLGAFGLVSHTGVHL